MCAHENIKTYEWNPPEAQMVGADASVAIEICEDCGEEVY